MPQPQHLLALQKANEIRLARSAMKRDLRSGKIGLEEAITDERAATMPVGQLLAAQYRWGEARARRVLVRMGVSEGRQVRDLTDRQRDEILARARVPSGGSANA